MSSAPESKLPFAAEPREFPQERARRTYEALVEAGTAAFAERGFDATQTPDIAAAAGVSVGTFYRYFSDKKALFSVIVRKYLTRAHREILSDLTAERFADKGRRATIEETIAVLLENVSRQPGLHRVFLEMSMRDEEIAALKRAFDEEANRRLSLLVAAICQPGEVADPDATAHIIQTAVVECATVISGARGPTPVSPERSLKALTELVYRALFGI